MLTNFNPKKKGQYRFEALYFTGLGIFGSIYRDNGENTIPTALFFGKIEYAEKVWAGFQSTLTNPSNLTSKHNMLLDHKKDKHYPLAARKWKNRLNILGDM